MTTSVNEIAARLLEQQLPSGDVAGLLLELADIKNPVSMQTPPSEAAGYAIVRAGGWSKAATLALSGCTGQLAKTLAKSSSLQVRRLACTSTDDQETLKELHAWALAKNEADAMSDLVARIDPEWLLATIEDGTGRYTSTQRNVIAARAVRDVPDAFARIAVLPGVGFDMVRSTVQFAAMRLVPDWDLERVLDLYPDRRRDLLSAVAYTYTGVVDDVLLDSFAAEEHDWLSLQSNKFARPAGFTASAARRLIAATNSWGAQVASRQPDPEIFDLLIGLADYQTACALLRSSTSTLTRDQVQQMLCAVADSPRDLSRNDTSDLPNNLFDQVDYDLDTEALLAYLRLGADSVTWKWLGGHLRQKPRPGEITALLADPRFAFGSQTRYANSRYSRTGWEKPEVANKVLESVAPTATEGWIDELVDALDDAILKASLRTYSSWFQPYLVQRLTGAFGADTDAWRDALVHLSRSTKSVGRVIEAVKKLRSPRHRTTGTEPAMLEQLTLDLTA